VIAVPNLTPKSSFRISRRQFLQLAWISAAGLLVVNYPIFIERYWIQTNFYRIPVPNLPPAFNRLRIVHLSDFHIGFLMPEAIIEWVVWRANRLQADVIVCTGDYVHERNSILQSDFYFQRNRLGGAPGAV